METGEIVRIKNPGVAAFLSILVWPGSGNIYNGKFRHGFIWISTATAGWMLYVVQLGVFVSVLISIYILASLHAHRQARKINTSRTGSPGHLPGKTNQVKEAQSVYHVSHERGKYARSKR